MTPTVVFGGQTVAALPDSGKQKTVAGKATVLFTVG